MLTMEKPPAAVPGPQAAAPPPKGDFQYRNIKAKYFQSLNLGGDGPRRGTVNTGQQLASQPVHASQHRRARSKTFSASDTEALARSAALEIKGGAAQRDPLRTSGNALKTSGGAGAAGGDYFVPFAMSLPVHGGIPLGQSVIPGSVMPRHSLADRDVDDELAAELDEALEESFGGTKPISIPAGSTATAAADPPFFVDEEEEDVLATTLKKAALKPSFEHEQKRKEAKIRTLALGAD